MQSVEMPTFVLYVMGEMEKGIVQKLNVDCGPSAHGVGSFRYVGDNVPLNLVFFSLPDVNCGICCILVYLTVHI